MSAWGSDHLLAALSHMSHLGFRGIEVFGDTTHVFGENSTFLLASPTITYYLCIFAVLWGSSALAVNKYILLAFVLLGVVGGSVTI